MKEEAQKQSFVDFYFYYNELDINDKNNTNEKKFLNPHTALTNKIQGNDFSKVSTTTEQKQQTITFESKLSKIKQLSTSGSASSLMKQRISSSISTGGSSIGNSSSVNTSSVFKKSSSIVNFKY